MPLDDVMQTDHVLDDVMQTGYVLDDVVQNDHVLDDVVQTDHVLDDVVQSDHVLEVVVQTEPILEVVLPSVEVSTEQEQDLVCADEVQKPKQVVRRPSLADAKKTKSMRVLCGVPAESSCKKKKKSRSMKKLVWMISICVII